MAQRRAASRSLGRTVGVLQPRKTLLLFCEGARTEPEYFEALRRMPEVREKASVEIKIEAGVGGSAPLTLVRAAVDAKGRCTREKGEIDEFWCVFDVEWPTNHPNLTEAIRLAETNGIELAISNPCFELWLILHHKDHRSWLDTEAAIRARKVCDGAAGKGLAPEHYLPNRSKAVKRASALDRWHSQNGTTFPDDNPSSGVYKIVETLKSPATP
jgi:hypothetical protein